VTQTPIPIRRRLRALHAAIAGLLIVALAGCLKVDMDLSVHGDTVNGTVLAAIDRQTVDLFGMDPGDLFDSDEDDFATLDGVTAAPYEDGEWIGVEYVFDRVSLEDLNALASDDAEMPRFLHDEQAGTYEFLLTFDLSDWFSDDSDDLGMPGLDPAAIRDRFDVRVTVTFPGQVTEHNGELSGNTVTWTPEPGELTEMRAVAQASSPDRGDPAGAVGDGLPGASVGVGVGTLWALLVGLGVLVLAGTGGLVWWLSRRGSAPAAPAGDGAPVAAAAPADGATGGPGDEGQPGS
jgi:hypothetical protein